MLSHLEEIQYSELDLVLELLNDAHELCILKLYSNALRTTIERPAIEI
jgi:hypothetical protein